MENTPYDVVIVGTGAAGLAAAIYSGRYKLDTLVIGDEFGGATASAGKIWNYPGVLGADGYDLMKTMKKQAESMGAQIIDGYVTKLEKEGDCFRISTRKDSFVGNTVVLALGTERRHLGLPNEKELTGKGIHYCATCDAPLYANKTIAVVGGGDASVKGANLAGEYVDKIYLITMDKELNAEPTNLEQMKKLGSKVELMTETTVKEIVGVDKLESIVLSNGKKLEIDGLFVEIGAVPNVSLAKELGIELDDSGYIKTGNMMETSVPGVFAAGDTTNHFGTFKQDIVAAATGSVAASSAYQYHKKHGDLCEIHHQPRGHHDH